MQNFQGKVIWITGASSGIGAELAKQCAEAGAVIVLSGRNQINLEQVRQKLPHPESHLIVPLDLEHSNNFKELAASVVGQVKRIDILINNGGISQRGTAFETDETVDRRIMEVNYFGNIALAKAVLPYMRNQGAGHIVVLSSIAGKFGFFLRSAYSASKHALHGFYESLMLEEEGNGIKVTIACPGKINTNISVNALNSSGESHGVMDHNQETGMTADECARIMLHAVLKGKKEVLIGNKEIKAVTLKRFLPALFWKIIRKQSAT
jgi:dehydrogenase/reductase SDR family protein 7B